MYTLSIRTLLHSCAVFRLSGECGAATSGSSLLTSITYSSKKPAPSSLYTGSKGSLVRALTYSNVVWSAGQTPAHREKVNSRQNPVPAMT
jgi:hypothetical protein